MALPVILGLEVVKQLFKFGGSFRKEAIAVSMAPAVVSIYGSMQEACVDGCAFSEAMFAPSGVQWAAVITSTVALIVHLNSKRKEADND